MSLPFKLLLSDIFRMPSYQSCYKLHKFLADRNSDLWFFPEGCQHIFTVMLVYFCDLFVFSSIYSKCNEPRLKIVLFVLFLLIIRTGGKSTLKVIEKLRKSCSNESDNTQNGPSNEVTFLVSNFSKL